MLIDKIVRWKPIPGFSRYAASSRGEIKRVVDGGTPMTAVKILSTYKNKRGYVSVPVTSDDGKSSSQRRARLVALAFHGDPPTTDHQIDHLNNIRDDDRPTNLEWVTPKDNIRRAWQRDPEAKRAIAKRAGTAGGRVTGDRIKNDLEFQRRFVVARNAVRKRTDRGEK